MSLAKIVAAIIAGALFADAAQTQTPPAVPAVVMHDGAHDFDFLVGDWRAHLWRLPDRLVGSTKWLEYEGNLTRDAVGSSNASDGRSKP